MAAELSGPVPFQVNEVVVDLSCAVTPLRHSGVSQLSGAVWRLALYDAATFFVISDGGSVEQVCLVESWNVDRIACDRGQARAGCSWDRRDQRPPRVLYSIRFGAIRASALGFRHGRLRRGVDHVLIVPARIIRSFKRRVLCLFFS